ncbi:hypothetical protein GCM10027429_16230 [Marivirga atlantica]|jgi:hypothetical protein|uniref:T9SS type A sorting domain-containing protein n=1 Tax=Marivirga atlantica TaxID=1548457 RepID=A0A937AAE9_9BACT|nr:T9SS type A sorting domain-containing protein [Marivirga atlantica]MBL0765240.1 T9SS type A sorting domain-containing protein [Marivirga atlantica]
MRYYIVPIIILISLSTSLAQSINNAGETVQNEGIQISWSLGNIAYPSNSNVSEGGENRYQFLDKATVTSIQKEWNINISFFPNPTKGTLNITHDLAYKTINISVSNLDGQNIIHDTMSSNSKTIDLSKLQEGIYLISLESENQLKTFKILKK